MAGTIPVSGKFTMQKLADTLTRHEELTFEQVTGLAIDPTKVGNLVTTIGQPTQLGPLAICAKGAKQDGDKILSTTAYITGVKKQIDVYRLTTAAAGQGI